MNEIITNLDYEFNIQLHHLKREMAKLNPQERQRAIEWANKLKSASSTLEEIQLRNDILFYLVKCCEAGVLTLEPFDTKPPCGPLLSVYNLLPKDLRKRSNAKEEEKKKPKLPEIFERSPDKGAFLAAQPVPRCGAFCYLAILSKSSPSQN